MISEIVRVTRRGQITLPASFREAMDVEEGDYIQFLIEGTTTRLIVKKLIEKSQAYFWTREWQEGEHEAEADIRLGRLKTFDSVDELIAELKS